MAWAALIPLALSAVSSMGGANSAPYSAAKGEYEKYLQEAKDSKHDMPAMLIMRRKSIRQMANGQKVALYYVDKLDKYVTIPYGENTWFTTMESMEPIADDVIVQLNNIVENDCTKNVRFENGESTKVNVRTAKTVLKVYESLNEENKSRIRYAGNSKEHFGKVVDFARKHTRG